MLKAILKLSLLRRPLILLFLLAFVIHFILLSSQRYSWIENGTLTPAELMPAAAGVGAAGEMSPLPPSR